MKTPPFFRKMRTLLLPLLPFAVLFLAILIAAYHIAVYR